MSDRHPYLSFLILAACLVPCLFSCDRNRIYDHMARIPDNQWAQTSPVTFDFNIADSSVYYNIYFYVRNTTAYPYSNLYLFVTTNDPAGNAYRDTVNCILAKPDGSWLGKGHGKLRESRLLFQKDWLFPSGGPYRIKVEQAMRETMLSGIADIGLRIEQSR
ncbi:MAG TPA: gliding motility lipoprotein GldH [Bacteroidales bacterium]|nr:gliding motility lipoprotein GldH [Bacteroidales bacterium]HSA43169.1 gliding motility lipoprotein GldH [Bacteroidales bacterium]